MKMRKLFVPVFGLLLAGALCLAGCPKKDATPKDSGAPAAEKQKGENGKGQEQKAGQPAKEEKQGEKDARQLADAGGEVPQAFLTDLCDTAKSVDMIANDVLAEFQLRMVVSQKSYNEAAEATIKKTLEEFAPEIQKQKETLKAELGDKYESCSASGQETGCDYAFKQLEKASEGKLKFENMKFAAEKMGVTTCGIVDYSTKSKSDKTEKPDKFIVGKIGSDWKILTFIYEKK
jgi:hypothetical protein